jgi:hypothetical protein
MTLKLTSLQMGRDRDTCGSEDRSYGRDAIDRPLSDETLELQSRPGTVTGERRRRTPDLPFPTARPGATRDGYWITRS